jgi:hypothetical protein
VYGGKLVAEHGVEQRRKRDQVVPEPAAMEGIAAMYRRRSMEYRDVQYTLEEDGLGGWRWTVVLGSPPTVKSGHVVRKGTAILKVWAAIDRALGSRQFKRLRRNGPRPDFGNDSRFRD